MIDVLEKIGFRKRGGHKEREVVNDPVVAYQSIVDRLEASDDEVVNKLGQDLKEKVDYLKSTYKETKNNDSALTAEKFMSVQSFTRQGESVVIPGPNWEVGRSTRRSGYSQRTALEILGAEEEEFDKVFPFPTDLEYPTRTVGFIFEKDGGEKGHARFAEQRAPLQLPNETSAGLRLNIRRDVGGKLGEYFLGKGDIGGMAVEVPLATLSFLLED